MHPELLKIGSLTLYSYGFFIMLGVFFAYLYIAKHRSELGFSFDKISEMFLLCFLGVFLGGKLFFFLEKPVYYIQNPSEMISQIGQGFVFYGSFLFTIPLLIWWFKKQGVSPRFGFDYLAIGGALVHGFGKIGCFMAGCCHGATCNSDHWYTVRFTDPKTVAEPLNTPLYSVQLWDAIVILGIAAFCIWKKNSKKFNGELFLIYGFVYAIGRFISEFYRGDESRGYLFNHSLTHSQFIAIFVVMTTLFFCFLWTRESKTLQDNS